jgi:glycosyltransferase involved in cell wall biosynthesis
MTHPIQYYAPWFRFITATVPEIDLTVHYCVTPTPEQQGVGFEKAFLWDSSLLDGYRSVILRQPSRRVNVHSSAFLGVRVPEIATSLRQAEPDVVLVPGWYSVSLVIAAISARTAGIPVMYRGDSLPGAVWWPDSIAKQARTRAMLSMFTHYLSVGERNHEYLRSYSIPESRIFFSPHCVDNDFFARHAQREGRENERSKLGIDPHAFVALFAGKLQKKKRPTDLIEAASLMNRPVTLVFAGSGQLEHKCQELAAKLGVDARFLGFRNQRELARLYGLADCLVLASGAGETWGLVVNEALAAGLPCIVSDRVGCGPDLILRGKTGYIVPFANIPAIAGAMANLRRAKDEGHDFSPDCKTRVAGYSFAAATKGLRAAVASAVNRTTDELTKTGA